MISIRRLVALDIVGLGGRVAILEFAIGVVGPLILGVATLFRTTSIGGTFFGLYLLALSLNYIPLLLHAIDLQRSHSAPAEIARESDDPRRLFGKYQRISLWLLLPGAVPVLALIEHHHRRSGPL